MFSGIQHISSIYNTCTVVTNPVYTGCKLILTNLLTLSSFSHCHTFTCISHFKFLAHLSRRQTSVVHKCMNVCQHFQTSPQKFPGQSKSNFICCLHGMGERKFVQPLQVTWPRWPPCPYMVKTLKYLLQNQKANDLETQYAASGALVLPSLFKWWPWVDLDLFYGKVKFGPLTLCFCMGKG